MKKLLWEALIFGTLAALATGALTFGIAHVRGDSILAWLKDPPRKSALRALLVTTTAFLLLLPMVFMVEAQWPEAKKARWEPVTTKFSGLGADESLSKLEVKEGTMTDEIAILIQGALESYSSSLEFYKELATDAKLAPLRQPLEGEWTALVVTDRHNNVGMDPAARALAANAQAKVLLTLGDDTASGGEWENFSIHSLADAFKGFSVFSVAGNHDAGHFTSSAMEEAGFHVLDEGAATHENTTFIGLSDPRASQWGKGFLQEDSPGEKPTLESQDRALRREACRVLEETGRRPVVLVHAASYAKRVTESGCASLVLAGHLHRQVGPSLIEGVHGPTVTLTTGTTGGAAYTFALGSKLRKDAQATVVTFNGEGEPVGLQVVTFTTGGVVKPGRYKAFSGLKEE